MELEEYSDEELLSELEYRGTALSVSPEDIYSLRDDFILWNSSQLSDDTFKKSLKKFFKSSIDDYIV